MKSILLALLLPLSTLAGATTPHGAPVAVAVPRIKPKILCRARWPR